MSIGLKRFSFDGNDLQAHCESIVALFYFLSATSGNSFREVDLGSYEVSLGLIMKKAALTIINLDENTLQKLTHVTTYLKFV